MTTMKQLLHRIWFATSRWSKEICPCCGYKFKAEDTIIKIVIGEKAYYYHDDCLSEMDGKEALEHFGIDFEEVEI